MYIAMIAPEMAPAAKVGGLADVVTSLSRELRKQGHQVEVFLPMHSCMRYDQIADLQCVYEELWVPHHDQWRPEKVFHGEVSGVPTYFVTGGNYTERDSIYGYDDDLFRFVFFCRAALEFMFKTDKRPDILHAHDWAVAIAPVIYYEIYSSLGWDNSRCVFTIHNNECQGLCWYADKLLGMVGLDAGKLSAADKLQDSGKPNCINLMRGGIVYANFVSTVSPTFAQEMRTHDGGRGLDCLLSAKGDAFGGVLNGIDTDLWNPATDNKIAAAYSLESFAKKYDSKAALRQWLHLREEWKPIVSVVSRLTRQKGLHLLKHAVHQTLELGGQFVLLGDSPDPRVNGEFWDLKNSLEGNKDVHLYLGYHEDLAHLIYAGSDLFLVPSMFEPCGLTQMIALRYGTVPVVRKTGGLNDTVFDVDYSHLPQAKRNGYVFEGTGKSDLDSALNRAVGCWFEHAEAFNRLARNCLRCNYSWRGPAADYLNIYHHIKN